LAGGLNGYGYAGQDPMGAVDPTGLQCTTLHGTIQCDTPDGPAFVIPAQPGFPLDFTSSNLLYHSYDVVQPLNGATSQCILDKIKNNPTPGNPSPATPEGTVNNASVDYVAPVNIVTSYLTTDLKTGNQLVVNVTGAGSAFGPGYVARWVKDGVIHTSGEGTSWIQSPLVPASVRAIANELVWGKQMAKFVAECNCQK
jgi:hypothetical protein